MLLFYDFEFNLLFSETRVISSRWTLYYNDIGTFEAHLPLSSKVMDIIEENPYIVVLEAGRSAIIVGNEISDELVLYGRTCNWILKKRIAPSAENQTGSVGNICRSIVLDNFSDVDNFTAEEWTSSDDIAEVERNTPSAVSDLVREFLNIKKLGHCVDFDKRNKKWIFRITEGKALDLILSEGNKNAYDTRIQSDILDFASCGYYSLETTDGTIRTLYDSGEKSGIYRWEADLSASSENEAIISLAEKKKNNNVTLMTRGIKFEKDYCLGDTARIQIIKGSFRTTLEKRITGAELRFSEGRRTEQPIFGDI